VPPSLSYSLTVDAVLSGSSWPSKQLSLPCQTSPGARVCIAFSMSWTLTPPPPFPARLECVLAGENLGARAAP